MPRKRDRAAAAEAHLQKMVREGHEVTVNWRFTSVPGSYCHELTVSTMPMPLGRLDWRWIDSQGHTIEILYVWTCHLVLRCGVATRLLQELRAQNPRCITSGAGTTSGAAWMRANGFRRDPVRGWLLRT